MLCTELPTLENGKAVAETTPGRQAGRGADLHDPARTPPGATARRSRPGTCSSPGRSAGTRRAGSAMPRCTAGSGSSTSSTTRRSWCTTRSWASATTPSTISGCCRSISSGRCSRRIPATYRNRTLFDTDPTNPGLAFGPYRIAQLEPGSQIVLERNPTWWGEPPAFERIVIKAIENTTALEANLLSGEVDMIEGSARACRSIRRWRFERRHGDRFQVLYKPGLVYEHMDVMLDNPILADVRVRQALLYGARPRGDQPAAVRRPPARGRHAGASAGLGAHRRRAALRLRSGPGRGAARRGRLAAWAPAACAATQPASRCGSS